MDDLISLDHELRALRKENEQLRSIIGELSKIQSTHEDTQLKTKGHDSENCIFRNALMKVSDSIIMVSADGDILYANNQFLEEYGLDKNFKGKIYDLPTSLKSQEALDELIDKIRENDNKFVYQAEYLNPAEGSSHTHQVSAFIMNTDGGETVWFFMQDITELSTGRDKLRDINSLFDAILDNLPVYLFVKDVDNEFRYVYWNKAFADYSKIPASKVIGNTDFEVFPCYDDALKFRNDDVEVLNSGEPISRHETYEAADGTTRIVQTTKTLVHREGKGPLLIGLSWDITNMQDIEQELVQERMRAENSDRLKSTFLANMSHEIRTPLNAIVGFSDLLTQTEDEESKAQFASIIRQNSEILLQLINDILDLSKIEAGTLEYVRAPLDLNELFESIYETNRGRMREGVELVLDRNVPNSKVIVNEDRNRLTQVVTNLINNAIKFTSHGEIRFGFEIKDNIIEAYVNDTGVGIAPEKIEKVFDRFVKLNTFAQGTGLGLSICRLIINIIGGKIWVESEIGKGSSFRFTMPYEMKEIKNIETLQVKDAKAEPAKENKKGNNTPTNLTTILVAEDTHSNFLLLKALIGKKFNLLWAKDGQEAVRMYKECNPKLILMDMKMPKMDGLEATRMIRSYSKDIPIVALTAFAFEADKKKAYDAGVNDYLTKPLTLEALTNSLNKFF